MALNLCSGHLGWRYLPDGLLKFSRSIMPHSCLTCAIFNEDTLKPYLSKIYSLISPYVAFASAAVISRSSRSNSIETDFLKSS